MDNIFVIGYEKMSSWHKIKEAYKVSLGGGKKPIHFD